MACKILLRIVDGQDRASKQHSWQLCPNTDVWALLTSIGGASSRYRKRPDSSVLSGPTPDGVGPNRSIPPLLLLRDILPGVCFASVPKGTKQFMSLMGIGPARQRQSSNNNNNCAEQFKLWNDSWAPNYWAIFQYRDDKVTKISKEVTDHKILARTFSWCQASELQL